MLSRGRPAGRAATSRMLTPNRSTREYPLGTGTANTGVRGCTVITTVDGQDLLTWTDCTCLIASTRRAIVPVSTRMSGVPYRTRAAARTCAAGTAWPPPVTLTERTTSSREPSRAHASTATIVTPTAANTTALPLGRRRLRLRPAVPSARAPAPGSAGRRGGLLAVLPI